MIEGDAYWLKKLFEMTLDDLRKENTVLSAIMFEQRDKALKDAYLEAVSVTCDVEETGDYYSGFCDGVQAAAAAVERMK